MPEESTSELTRLKFTRGLDEARDFEKAAFKDITQYIEMQDADLGNAKVAAYWLEGQHSGDARYICVLFLIPYAGGGIGVYGYRIYIAMPEKLFGAEIDSYLFGGDMTLDRNEEGVIASGSSSMSRFHDLTTLYQGHVAQIYAFDDSETGYKRVYPSRRASPDEENAVHEARLRDTVEAAAPRLLSQECSKVRWRSYQRASETEKSLADWIVTDVFPERHDPRRIEEVVFSRQRLFPGDQTLQHLVVIPSAYDDYPSFYIVYLEGTDNPAVIGENLIARALLYIHGNWVVEGAKVLSSVVDDEWVGYVYDGARYLLSTPSHQPPWRKRLRSVGSSEHLKSSNPSSR